ncbi:Dyp-type peroxidase domain-containing protein [Streptomyces griseoluteus]|uniref:Dyp-type peroxidase domain-containing protein n=1 Tax=Streptomyces griseoluteus TaxID=29306 RepID=UPI00369EF268
MTETQPVVVPPAKAAVFLVVTTDEGGEDTVRGLREDVQSLRRPTGYRDPDAQLSCVVGMGSAAWDRLFTGPRPAGLHPLAELDGERHKAPGTPGDLLDRSLAHSTAVTGCLCHVPTVAFLDTLPAAPGKKAAERDIALNAS